MKNTKLISIFKNVNIFSEDFNNTIFNNNGDFTINRFVEANVYYKLNGEYTLNVSMYKIYLKEELKTDYICKIYIGNDYELFRINNITDNGTIITLTATQLAQDSLRDIIIKDNLTVDKCNRTNLLKYLFLNTKNHNPFTVTGSDNGLLQLYKTSDELEDENKNLLYMMTTYIPELYKNENMEITYNKFHVTVKDKFENDTGYVFSPGKNITSIEKTINDSNLITALWVKTTGGYKSADPVYAPNYMDYNKIYYGYAVYENDFAELPPEKQDEAYKQNVIKIESDMKNFAKSKFSEVENIGINYPSITIQIALKELYDNYLNNRKFLKRINLGDKVYVIINNDTKEYRISSFTYSLRKNQYLRLEIGDIQKFTDMNDDKSNVLSDDSNNNSVNFLIEGSTNQDTNGKTYIKQDTDKVTVNAKALKTGNIVKNGAFKSLQFWDKSISSNNSDFIYDTVNINGINFLRIANNLTENETNKPYILQEIKLNKDTEYTISLKRKIDNHVYMKIFILYEKDGAVDENEIYKEYADDNVNEWSTTFKTPSDDIQHYYLKIQNCGLINTDSFCTDDGVIRDNKIYVSEITMVEGNKAKIFDYSEYDEGLNQEINNNGVLVSKANENNNINYGNNGIIFNTNSGNMAAIKAENGFVNAYFNNIYANNILHAAINMKQTITITDYPDTSNNNSSEMQFERIEDIIDNTDLIPKLRVNSPLNIVFNSSKEFSLNLKNFINAKIHIEFNDCSLTGNINIENCTGCIIDIHGLMINHDSLEGRCNIYGTINIKNTKMVSIENISFNGNSTAWNSVSNFMDINNANLYLENVNINQYDTAFVTELSNIYCNYMTGNCRNLIYDKHYSSTFVLVPEDDLSDNVYIPTYNISSGYLCNNMNELNTNGKTLVQKNIKQVNDDERKQLLYVTEKDFMDFNVSDRYIYTPDSEIYNNIQSISKNVLIDRNNILCINRFGNVYLKDVIKSGFIRINVFNRDIDNITVTLRASNNPIDVNKVVKYDIDYGIVGTITKGGNNNIPIPVSFIEKYAKEELNSFYLIFSAPITIDISELKMYFYLLQNA